MGNKKVKMAFGKRISAFSLAAIMAFSGMFLVPQVNQASAKKPSVASKTSVLVNGSRKLRISKAGFRILSVKVKSSNHAVKASATKSSVRIYGLKAGAKATVTTMIKAKKNGVTKKVIKKTKVHVKAPTARLNQTAITTSDVAFVVLSNVVPRAKVTYFSSDNNIASITNDGLIKPLNGGTVTVYAKILLPSNRFAVGNEIVATAGTLTIKDTRIKEMTVANDQELVNALANGNLQTLTIGAQATNITIPSGYYPKVDLIVEAPYATVTNYATFKSITIKAVSNNSFVEKANDNRIVCYNLTPMRLLVNTTGKVASIAFNSASAQTTTLEVQNGVVSEVGLNTNAPIQITANGNAYVQNVRVAASAKAVISGNSKNITNLDIKNAPADTRIKLTTKAVVVHTTPTVKIADVIDNRSGADIKVQVYNPNGTVTAGVIKPHVDKQNFVIKANPQINSKGVLTITLDKEIKGIIFKLDNHVLSGTNKGGSYSLNASAYALGGKHELVLTAENYNAKSLKFEYIPVTPMKIKPATQAQNVYTNQTSGMKEVDYEIVGWKKSDVKVEKTYSIYPAIDSFLVPKNITLDQAKKYLSEKAGNKIKATYHATYVCQNGKKITAQADVIYTSVAPTVAPVPEYIAFGGLVNGNMVVGQTITAKLMSKDHKEVNVTNCSYQWYRLDPLKPIMVAISGANHTSYAVRPEDEGKYLFVEVVLPNKKSLTSNALQNPVIRAN